MNKEIADKWVGALRSGKYEQGKDTLKDIVSGTHCCLGVLCEVFLQEVPLGKRQLQDSDVNFKTYLPLEIQRWAGLLTPNGYYGVDEENERCRDVNALAGDNDNRDFSFDQIAEVIENKWEVL